jgi:hypothetical protein
MINVDELPPVKYNYINAYFLQYPNIYTYKTDAYRNKTTYLVTQTSKTHQNQLIYAGGHESREYAKHGVR